MSLSLFLPPGRSPLPDLIKGPEASAAERRRFWTQVKGQRKWERSLFGSETKTERENRKKNHRPRQAPLAEILPRPLERSCLAQGTLPPRDM